MARTAAVCLAQAGEALSRWIEIVRARDVDGVRGRENERRAYFETFLVNDGLSCRVTVRKQRVSHLLGTVVIGGLYAFTMMCDGEPAEVPARFLFIFEEMGGRWRITGHRSSKALDDM